MAPTEWVGQVWMGMERKEKSRKKGQVVDDTYGSIRGLKGGDDGRGYVGNRYTKGIGTNEGMMIHFWVRILNNVKCEDERTPSTKPFSRDEMNGHRIRQ